MVYVNLYGNLGNLLFQYGTAASLRRGKVVGVTSCQRTIEQLRGYGRLFKGLEVVPTAPSDVLLVSQHLMDHTEFPASDGRDLALNGYFQGECYLDKGLMYNMFGPDSERIASLEGRFGDWLSRPGVTGISVRRGDYLRKAAWHPFVGERYFLDCIARLPDVRDFIVCSDGMEWCKNFFPKAFPGRHFLFVEGESVLDQLYVHTLCANNIVSNSSFSWWGAWLAERRRRAEGVKGVTLAPSMWLGYLPRRRGVDWSDVYFDGMEIVKNSYTMRLWLTAHFPVFAEKS